MTTTATNNAKRDYVKEVALGIQRRSDATAFIRDVLNQAKEDGLDKKEVKALAKLYIEQNAEQVLADVSALVDTYNSLDLT